MDVKISPYVGLIETNLILFLHQYHIKKLPDETSILKSDKLSLPLDKMSQYGYRK